MIIARVEKVGKKTLMPMNLLLNSWTIIAMNHEGFEAGWKPSSPARPRCSARQLKRPSQCWGPGQLDLPRWEAESQKQVRDALLILASSLPDTARMFGSREKVDPVRHLIGTASAWGGNPETEALYLNVTPSKNDGATIYMLNVPANVPVSGFWSISRYGADGYYHANELNAYTLNNMTAKKEPDGSTKVQFGGCSKGIENCLPIESGWNYMVRLYRPGASVLDGSWKFPDAVPVK